ncbi:hypothetical protein BGZ99_000433 [Dissophora globulifera]|uniref:HSF-type DNA-binding domain-containing protein n=1 Tax=Dissophora globulifera TaxID=979702 RepID=A0A9P6R0U2_9FUNG|nr:hypothetical protein BGZ99_000433 [Dissophora globulifera]
MDHASVQTHPASSRLSPPPSPSSSSLPSSSYSRSLSSPAPALIQELPKSPIQSHLHRSTLPSPSSTPAASEPSTPTLTLNLTTLAAVAAAYPTYLFETPSASALEPRQESEPTAAAAAAAAVSKRTFPAYGQNKSAMTVSTTSRDESTVLDRTKRHQQRDQDYSDSDRVPSDMHEHLQLSRRLSAADSVDHSGDTETDPEGRSAVHPPRQRSSSPSHSGTSQQHRRPQSPSESIAFQSNSDSHDNASGVNDSTQRRRSDSFEGIHGQPVHGSASWSEEDPTEDMRIGNDDDDNNNETAGQRRTKGDLVGERVSPSRSSSQGGDEVDMQDDLMYDDDNLDDDGSEENEDGMISRDETNSGRATHGADNDSTTTDGASKPIKVRSMFVDKLYRMVEDPSIQHLISWAKEGDMFYVYNCIKLADAVLPKFFKHNNWQSFVRQLNMYGFHKKESSLNRKNPETQRWQFYHPHFQRDFPQLRDNIKRKSARSMNTAPATSRVVFEHGKGYFLQRNDRSRSNSGEGGYNIPGQSHMLNRQSPPNLSPGHQHQMPHHQQPAGSSIRHSSQTSPVMLANSGTRPHVLVRSPREQDHRDVVMVHRDRPADAHQHRLQEQPRPGMHQRQHTYPSFHSSERVPGSSNIPQDPRFSRPGPPPSYISTSPSALGARNMEASHASGTYPNNEHDAGGLHPPSGHHRSHSVPGFDYRPPKLQTRELEQKSSFGRLPDASHSPLGPQQNTHGAFGPKQFQHSAHSPSSQQMSSELSREGFPYGPSGDLAADGEGGFGVKRSTNPSQLQQHHQVPHVAEVGSLAYKDQQQSAMITASGSKFSAPPPPPPPSATNAAGVSVSTSGGPVQVMPSPAILSPSLTPTTQQHQGQLSSVSHPIRGPSGSPRSPPQHGSQVIVKDLETRIHFVEDAYMSLRQYTQKLEQMQTSQDRTIQWMRDRIEQLSDVVQVHRDTSAISRMELMFQIIITTISKFSSSDNRKSSNSNMLTMIRDEEDQPQVLGHTKGHLIAADTTSSTSTHTHTLIKVRANILSVIRIRRTPDNHHMRKGLCIHNSINSINSTLIIKRLRVVSIAHRRCREGLIKNAVD